MKHELNHNNLFLTQTLTVLAAACAFAASCALASCNLFGVNVSDYFDEYTNTAVAMEHTLDGDYPEDNSGVTCIPSGSDCTVTLTLRNPRKYTLTGSCTYTDAATAIITANGIAAPISFVQNSSDATQFTATISDTFLTAMECGGDISFAVSFTDTGTDRTFDPYTVELHANSAPPEVDGTVVCIDPDTNTYVLCFNMPEKALMASSAIHRDITTLTINGTSYGVTVAQDGSFTLSNTTSLVQSMTVSANSNASSLSFTAGEQPVYFKTGTSLSADNTTYEVTLTDSAGLASTVETSVYAKQLAAVTAMRKDGTNISSGTSTAASVTQEDDGTGLVTITVPSVTTDSQSYDTTGAYVVYKVYTGDTFTTLYKSGKSSGTSTTLTLPAGKCKVNVYARKTLYADSAPVTFFCNVVQNIVYVSSSGTVAATGTATEPVDTINAALNRIKINGDPAADNYIYVLSDLIKGTATGTNFITIDESGFVVTIAGVDESRNAVQRTIDAQGSSTNTGCVMMIANANTVTLQNVTLTGGYSDNGGGVYMEVGTLNLQSGARIGYTEGTEAATENSCSNYAMNCGGGIYMVANSGTEVNIYDGACVSYNYCVVNGAGVFMDGNDLTDNRDTFKMYGGEIAYNSATNECGGVLLQYTKDSSMEAGSIHHNTAKATAGGGAGINIFNGATFTMSGGSINNNSATTSGGGVFVRWDGTPGHENKFIMTGGVISGNTASLGNGVANDYNFTIGGTAVVATNNDVYLDSYASYLPYITVEDGYSVPSGYSYGAVITWYYGNSILDTKVLAAESGTLSYAQCNMFALTKLATETNPTTAGISDLYCIAPSGGNGVIAKAGTGITPTYTAPASYALSISTDTVVPGGTISLKIKNGGSNVTNPTSASIALYQSGSPTGVSSSSSGSLPSLTMPTWIVAGSYTVYMTAVIDGNSYSGFVPLTVMSEYTKTVKEDGTTTYTVAAGATKETVIALLGNTDSNAKEIIDLSSLTIESFKEFCGSGPGSSYWCYAGVIEITLPTTLTTYDGQMFQSATNLRSISISSDNAYFSTKDGVLYNKAKTAILRYPPAKSGDSFMLPDTVTKAGYGAFENTNLTTITNFVNITTILDKACFHGSHIQTLTLSSSLAEIPAYTFENSKIETLNVPDSVTSIGYDAFHNCASMTEIHFTRTTPPAFDISNNHAVFEGHNSSLMIYVPSAVLSAYKVATNWSAVATLMEGE